MGAGVRAVIVGSGSLGIGIEYPHYTGFHNFVADGLPGGSEAGRAVTSGEPRRRAARERLGVEPIEIPGGHCPFLSRPGDLAEALERCS